MANACSLPTIQELTTWVDQYLQTEGLPRPSEYSWQLTGERKLTDPVGIPPWGDQPLNWQEVAKTLNPTVAPLGALLDQLSQRFPELRPTQVWATPQGRAMVQKLLLAGSVKEGRELIAQYLTATGRDSAAVVVRHPFLLSLYPLAVRGEPRPRPGVTPEVSGKVGTVFHVHPDTVRVLRTIAEDPVNWPLTAHALSDEEGLISDLIANRDALKNQLLTLAQASEIPGVDETTPLLDLVAALKRQGQGELVDELVRESHLPTLSEDPVELFYQKIVQLAQQDIDRRLAAAPKVLPDWFRQLGKPFLALRAIARELGVTRIGFILNNLLQDTIIKPFLSGYGDAVGPALAEFRAYGRAFRLAVDWDLSPGVVRELGIIPPSGADLALRSVGITRLPEELSLGFLSSLPPELGQIRWEQSALFNLPLLGKLWLKGAKVDFTPVAAVFQSPARFAAFVAREVRAQEMATRKAIFAAAAVRYLTGEGWQTFLLHARELVERHGVADALPRLEQALAALPQKTPKTIVAAVLSVLPGERLLARQLGFAWMDQIERGVRFGLEETNRVNYDYLRRTVGDQILSFFFKYHFWASRNLPFYLEEFLRHRAVYLTWLRWLRLVGEEKREGKRPGRVGAAVKVWDGILFGQHLQAYLDLWDLISVASQVTPDEVFGQTLYDQLTQAVGHFGTSPNFDIALLASLLGYDTRPSLPSPAGWLTQTTRSLGIGEWGPAGSLVRGVRSRTSGVLPGSRKIDETTISGDPILDRLIWRELIILAVERTGQADNPRYQAALATPDDPLYQEAKARVLARLRLEGLASEVSPLRLSLESGEEQQLREAQARAGWSDLPWDARRPLVAYGSPLAWSVFLPQDGREAQIRSAQALLTLARIKGMASEVDQADLLNRYPWYGAYEVWRRSRPVGADRSVGTFLSEVDSGRYVPRMP